MVVWGSWPLFSHSVILTAVQEFIKKKLMIDKNNAYHIFSDLSFYFQWFLQKIEFVFFIWCLDSCWVEFLIKKSVGKRKIQSRQGIKRSFTMKRWAISPTEAAVNESTRKGVRCTKGFSSDLVPRHMKAIMASFLEFCLLTIAYIILFWSELMVTWQ